MFASQTTSTVSITMGDGTVNVVTIQKLNWKRLREASEMQAEHAMSKAAKAGPEVIAMWERQNKKPDKPDAVEIEPSVEEQRKARYAAYDRETVLLYGVTKWTTSRNLAEGLGDLDDETSELLFKKILDLSLPPLTKTEAEALKGEG